MSLNIVSRAVLMETGGGRFSGVRDAMRSGYVRAAKFAGDHMPNVVQYPYHGVRDAFKKGTSKWDKVKKAGQWGATGFRDAIGERPKLYGALGAAGLAGAGYGAYRMYARRKAQKAAKEAYDEVYATLMEAAYEEGQQPRRSAVRKWGGRAIKAAALAGAAHLGAGMMMGGIKGYGAHKLGQSRVGGMFRGAKGGLRRAFTQPLQQYRNAAKSYDIWRNKNTPWGDLGRVP